MRELQERFSKSKLIHFLIRFIYDFEYFLCDGFKSCADGYAFSCFYFISRKHPKLDPTMAQRFYGSLYIILKFIFYSCYP